jgi:predicted  nucleic acid-binding Zn-ribbon protein
MGIFGFLSKAHLDQVQPTSSNTIKINTIDNQIKRQEIVIDRAEKTLTQLDKSIEVYLNNEYATRGLKERQKQEAERNELNTAIKNASDEIAKLSTEKANLQLAQDKIEAEVGPIKYVAELIYGNEAQSHFDEAVRIVILILIFVFDPLAVLLLIAANISLRQWKMKRLLVKENQQDYLKKKIEKLEKKNQKLKGYQDITKGLGDSPDEIKVKLNEIMSINDRQDRNI